MFQFLLMICGKKITEKLVDISSKIEFQAKQTL
jgi:hypothetical protein